MPRDTDATRRTFASDRGTATVGLLACLAVLSSAGCASAHNRAREQVLQRARQIAHETEPWATDSHNLEGWKSNESVLSRLVLQTGGTQLTSVVHNSDEHGVGLLATVEVVMTGAASGGWLSGQDVHYNICVRFVISREITGPREITPTTIQCPPTVSATASPGDAYDN
ncbi:hypothetical protein [Micromonospora sp. WMMD1082]|uniref:hypothetical protein n=1 Tax=Micromonospora sp. WMMD1082 TaxID=3016104 RepID=UPI002416DACC|nr:hypothetical protein [Micromonospora sp. WMMD1082]MDG4795467.1 hypothetical protein [Micromonospora sp. WMMD1082]